MIVINNTNCFNLCSHANLVIYIIINDFKLFNNIVDMS